MTELTIEDANVEAGKLAGRLAGSALHVVADKLVECFDGSGAVNYLDISFEHEDSKEVYILTMSKLSGISQGEKISQLNAEIDKLKRMMDLAQRVIHECDGAGHDNELDEYLETI